MPFVVVTQVENAPAANTIFSQGKKLDAGYIGEAFMGGFWTSQDARYGTALCTTGAGPCQIIIVHCRNSHGALGHYAAHTDPAVILQGLQSMLQALPGASVDAILFAAGVIGTVETQLRHQLQLTVRAQQLRPTARVLWPSQNDISNYSSAIYLPQIGRAAVFQGFPQDISGRSGAGNGLAPHDYPFT
jgi:hypothetical protein